MIQRNVCHVMSSEELSRHLSHRKYKIIDASWLNYFNRDAKQEYLSSHIPAAMFFDIDKVADTKSAYPRMLPSHDLFAKSVQDMGIETTDFVTVYDSTGVFTSPRVWWMFKYFGFDNVYVLDGGLKAWKAEKRPVISGLPARPILPANQKISSDIRPEMVADIERVKSVVQKNLAGDSYEQIIDARSGVRFRGEAPDPRGIPSGHMPTAKNISVLDIVDETGKFKSAKDLRKLVKDAGVDMNRPIICTCGTGIVAPALYFVLSYLGKDTDLSVFDGSWVQWAEHHRELESKIQNPSERREFRERWFVSEDPNPSGFNDNEKLESCD
eukprot:GHVL01044612.1.p1 GENE.GHVL01044612.1~~GHVL01044612.1.p1  ORF type:complete len:347 (+),score=58.86 GHVL01044612.1:66-1043(+)